MSLAANLLLHGTRGNFHPLRLSRSVIKAWWAADDLPDGSVTTWTDRINGVAPTQGTSGQRPLKASTSFNSAYPGVTFDGIDDNLTTTTLTALPTGSTPGEIWAVGNSVIGAGTLFSLTYGTIGALARRLGMGAGSGPANISDGATAVNSILGGSLSLPAIAKADFSGTSMNGYNNGIPFVTNPSTIATLNTSTARLRIGAAQGAAPASFWQGPVRHVVILQGVLSTVLRQKMEGWFAWDSGLQSILPSTHPYQLFRP